MDILDDYENAKPEPNMVGVDFDCQVCLKMVTEAFYDRQKNEIRYWCSDGHKSVMKEVSLDI